MEDLKTIVARYGSMKAEADSYKKQLDEDNKEIKRLMSEMGVNSCESDDFVAKYSVIVSENFDEDKLIKKLCDLDGVALGIIKMKPYVDMEALENAVYNGKVNAAELASCKVKKETPRLTISKRKKA